ncbi:PREDICTED: cell division cycle-associated protein 2 [Calidris pugnax]|uniref:cell division cycle-associated protein 2 n=1 Tax=Calidris pugnax TaxID=198806 RepID=UPI00071D8DE1|nr:PREDICTED: cell division cycle-associated protein 2 [Calidris pugnax]
MHRQSKPVHAPLEVKENEKEEASLPELSKDQKVCKVTKSKVTKASKKENLSDGNQVQLQKCTPKSVKGLEKESYHKEKDVVSCRFTEYFSDTQRGDVAGEHTLPLNSKENVSSRPVPLEDECYLTPNRDKAEEASDGGISEKWRKKPIDFATVTIAEFGITQESFTKCSVGKSPTSLKFRRRSAIGVQGSPEHNTLIRYLAQQRSNRQKEAFTQQASPFKQENVRSLKDKIDAFQTSFQSVREGEEETGLSGLAHVGGAPQEEGSYFSSERIMKDTGNNLVSDLSRKKVSFAEEVRLEIFDESKPPVTPVRTTGNSSLNEHTPSGSCLRSVLKKTPVKQLMDRMKEYSNGAVDTEGGESPAVSNCVKIFEALEKVEKAEGHSSEKPMKKRVTFGEALSPEIFDETLPANTPLRKGATPGRQPGLQSHSPSAGSSLIEGPLPQPNFDCEDECVQPLQELVDAPVAATDLLPAEKAEAETDKCDTITTRSSTKRKCSTISEGTDFSVPKPANTKNAKDTKNPRKNKFQRQKNITTSTVKKTQKRKHTGYGKRRKKKVKKSLYGEREMASKKPLLSPIPEIPEVLSSVSSPNSPKANAFFSEDLLDSTKSRSAGKDVQQKPVVDGMSTKNVCAAHACPSLKDLDVVEASSSDGTAFQVSDCDLNSISGIDHKFSSDVPDAKCGFDTPDYFQQGKETACVKEAKENGSLIENEKFQGNLLNEAEQVTRLEFLEQEDSGVPEAAQRTQGTLKDSVRGSPRRRRRRSSAIYFPPVEKLEITENSPPVSYFNVEEVLSAPQLNNDSLEPFRGGRDNNGKKVRRSMRLCRDAGIEGLAWIQVPNEIEKNPPLPASASKIRRTISTSILTEAENIHHREENLTQFSAPGKENTDSVRLANNSPSKRRRRSMLTPQETRTWSQTRKRSITNSVCRKDRSNQKHFEEVETPLENNSNI